MEKAKTKTGISRRDFLKGAGLVIGGSALGPVSFYSSCASGSSGIVVPPVSTVTVTGPPPAVFPSQIITLKINGREYQLPVKPSWTLDFVLRDKLGLFGTKVGCSTGECGSCTILSNGIPVLACLMLAVECQGLSLETIEGLPESGKLHPVQQSFFDHEAFQCGFCTPGFIMAAKALLSSNPGPELNDIREALSGHICTCGNFAKTVEAVKGVKA